MIALDTNLLVYAHRADTHWHARARALVTDLAQGSAPWGIPSPCLSEFLAVVTGFRAPVTPTPLETALAQAREWLRAPGVQLLHSGRAHAQTLLDLASAARLKGGQFQDARIAAICIENAVAELWAADRDFSRFPALRTRNPLVG